MVGSALVRKFLEFDCEIVKLSRTEANLELYPETYSFLEKHKPDVVIDAAAKVGGIFANDQYPVDFLVSNLAIQNNLLKSSFACGVKKFVFLGSSCIYPRDCDQPIKEEYLLSGPLETSNSAYAIAKIAGIELVKSYRKQYGVKWISIMPTNLYGPGDNFDLSTSHVFPALIHRFVQAEINGSKVVTLWGSGSPLRDFLHVDDLAKAVVLAVHKYDSDMPLNVGSGGEISIKDLALKVAAAIGFEGLIEWDPSKPDGTPRKVLDVSRLKALGWEPSISLDQGIMSTINWFKHAYSLGEVRR